MPKDERYHRNQAHCVMPVAGDYWHEMFCPYHVVLSVEPMTETLVICDEIVRGKDTFTFDISKTKVITFAEHEKLVRYGSIDGFVADVVPDRVPKYVEEYNAMTSDDLASMLATDGVQGNPYYW